LVASSPQGSKNFLDSTRGGVQAIADDSIWNDSGKKGATSFWQGVLGQAGASRAAGETNAVATVGGLKFDGGPEGTAGATSFWQAVQAQGNNSKAAGFWNSLNAKAGSIWDGTPTGKAGAVNFWQAIQAQGGNSKNAGFWLARNAAAGSIWDGSAAGSRGGVGFWQGIAAQAAAAQAAGASLAGSARSGAGFWDSFSSGAALGNQYAAGLQSAVGAVGAAALAISNTVRGMWPSSPAKDPRSPFYGLQNAPSALGASLASQYADGIRSQRAAVRSAAEELMQQIATPSGPSYVGAISARGALTAPLSSAVDARTIDNSRAATYAPTFQYVGPSPEQVSKDAQREFDWKYGQ
jgi:hypothetical protein